jgi:hypothetical protein
MTVEHSALVAKCQLSAYGAISSKHSIDCKWGVCMIFTVTGEMAHMSPSFCLYVASRLAADKPRRGDDLCAFFTYALLTEGR